jgi:amino acid adenylation domain-containing protein
MLITTVPCRVRIDKSKPLIDWLGQMQSDHSSVIERCQIGLAELQKVMGIAGDQKLFTTNFVFENIPKTTVNEGLEKTLVVKSRSGSNQKAFNDFDLQLILVPEKNGLKAHLEFDMTKLRRTNVVEIIEYFDFMLQTLVASLLQNPTDLKVGDVCGLPEERVQKLLQMGTGPIQEIPYEYAHYAFEEMAQKYPDMVAVEQSGRRITYQELDQQANELASVLINKGVQPGDYVAIVTMRSIEFIVGILAVLKAGGAYVPIDSEIPMERINYILQESACSVILYHPEIETELMTKLDSSKAVSLNSKATGMKWNPPHLTGPLPAYVIFTSGSTGKPKGVMIGHKSLSAIINARPNFLDVYPGKRVAQFVSISFDICVGEIFFTLCAGGTLVLRTKQDPYAVMKVVDAAFVTPSVLLGMEPEDYSNLKMLVTGGEPINLATLNKWIHRVEYVNCYGPTETTCVSSRKRLTSTVDISTGKPLPNTKQYILDSKKQLVPIGVPGELAIGGCGVGLGYLNQPQLSNDRFIPNHFENDGTKMYMTGDICRWTETGEIQVIGRVDDQVKLKGYRIELDEVAAVVSKCHDVSGCAVLVKDDMLVAFVTPNTLDVQEIRDFVLEHLPYYMAPATYVLLEEFPMNANGKVKLIDVD